MTATKARGPEQARTTGLVARGLSGLLVVYRYTLSPLLGPRCRFYPSCSQYALESLAKYSLSSALLKTGQRVLRCQPFHPGGIDLP